MMNIYDLVLL